MVASPVKDVRRAAAVRQEIDGWIARFHENWYDQAFARWARRLPEESAWRRTALLELIKADMSQRWKKSNPFLVEYYLSQFPELDEPMELVQTEIMLRRRYEKSVDVEEYRRRFPGHDEELRQWIGSAHAKPTSVEQRKKTTHEMPAVPPSLRRQLPSVAMLPAKFGRYTLLEALGRGKMGLVFLARDDQLGRQVALKTPDLDVDTDGAALKRFYREARTASMLHHPNLCPIHDFGEVDGVPYFTMTYIKGEPLSERMPNGKKLSCKAIASLVRKLALAMEEAHQQDIIHRDLKPCNIIIDKHNEPIIMDFGLARRVSQENPQENPLTKAGDMLGTPAYMPPEQVKGDLNRMGPAGDIYSLGVILYQLLAGQLPFRGSIAVVLRSVLYETPCPLAHHRPDIPPALDAICMKAMSKDISKRHVSMAHFAHELTAYLEGRPRSTSGSPGRKSRRGFFNRLLQRWIKRK